MITSKNIGILLDFIKNSKKNIFVWLLDFNSKVIDRELIAYQIKRVLSLIFFY